MSKKLSGSCPQEKRQKKNMKCTSKVENKFQKELQTLESMSDEDLDFSDIPELDLDKSGNPMVGKFYRPIKKPISIRMDADVLDWFKAHQHYQKLINKICRLYMHKHQAKG